MNPIPNFEPAYSAFVKILRYVKLRTFRLQNKVCEYIHIGVDRPTEDALLCQDSLRGLLKAFRQEGKAANMYIAQIHD